jgi:hypothetical protein
MTESKTLEGVVQALRKDGTGLLLKHPAGEEWLSYSRPEYREAWYDAAKGDEIRVLLNGSEYQGQTKWFVRSIIPMISNGANSYVEEAERIEGRVELTSPIQRDEWIWLQVLVKTAVELRIAAPDSETYMKAVADVSEAVSQWKSLA